MKKILLAILGLGLAGPWIAVMVFLLWIGFTQDAWISDRFLHWEGISFLLLPGYLFGGALAGINITDLIAIEPEEQPPCRHTFE